MLNADGSPAPFRERQQLTYPPIEPVGTSAPMQQRIATVGALPESPHAETAPSPVATGGGDRLQAIAEAAVLRVQAESRPGPPAGERHESLEARALARAAAAPSQEQRDLPLWTGNDLPAGPWHKNDGVLYDAYGAPQWRIRTAPATQQPPREALAETSPLTRGAGAYEPVGLRQAFTSTVAKAWADTVPPEHGTVEDLLEAVDAPLRELEEQWRRVVPVPRPGGERQRQTVPARPGLGTFALSRRDPEPVAAALRQVDTHATALQDLPEWQQLQTVRGAASHLWNVLRERAGEYFDQLHTDLRVQGFWRTLSLRTATAISNCARTLADRVRDRRRSDDLPTAEALLELSDTALAYSTPGIPHPDHPLADAAADRNVDEVRRLRTILRTGAPVPYGTREEAVHASREIAAAFQLWCETPMGRELTSSSEHPRVVAFRQAWQRLPATDLPDGPGTAAGPYGDVGHSAHTLVQRAEAANAERARAGQPPRFASPDLDALRTVATLADHHGSRLTATLPPAVTGPEPRRTPGLQTATRPPGLSL